MHSPHRSWRGRRASPFLRLTPLALALAATGCRRKAPDPAARAVAAVNHRLSRYEHFAWQMAHDSVANFFLPNGVLETAGQPSITGRDAILKHFKSFTGYQVLEDRMAADSTFVDGDSVVQRGSFEQRVRVPKGDTVQVHGSFYAIWSRDTDKRWRIRRMETLAPS